MIIKKKKGKMKVVTIYFSEAEYPILIKLDILAKKESRPRGGMIKRILEERLGGKK